MGRRKDSEGRGLVRVGHADRGMEEIEDLYRRMFLDGRGSEGFGVCSIRPEIKSHLHKRILTEIETLRDAQRATVFGSSDYWEIDRKIRRRLLKEIQIIIDAYFVARIENRLAEWEAMYGDIDHYKRDFFYFRMDPDYENQRKILSDYKFAED